MSGWQDRAVAVPEDSGGHWTDRATPVTPEAPSALLSGLRGLGQGATLGNEDEIIGALKGSLPGALKQGASDLGLYNSKGDNDVAAYIAARDNERAQNDAAHAAHPYLYGAGNLAGGILPAIATGGSLPALAGLGATAAIGESNASDPASLAKSAAIGGVGAAAGGKAIEMAAPYLGAGATSVKDYIANKLAAGAEDLTTFHVRPTAAVAKTYGPDGLRQISRTILNSGDMKFGQKVGQTAANLAETRELAGQAIEGILNDTDATVDPVGLADRIKSEVIDPLRRNSETEPIADMLEAKRQAFLDKHAPGFDPSRAPGTPTTITRQSKFIPQTPKTSYPDGAGQIAHDMQLEFGMGDPVDVEGTQNYYSTQDPVTTPPFKTDPQTGLPIKRIVERRIDATPNIEAMPAAQAEQLKRDIQGGINWITDPSIKQQALRDYSGVVRSSVENAVQDPNFIAGKSGFGDFAAATDMAERTAGLANGGTGLLGHITDVGVGTQAIAHLMQGNPAGLALGAARGLTRGRLSSAGAVTLDTLSNLVRTAPQALGKYAAPLAKSAANGSESLAITNFILGQSDPGYRAVLDGISKAPGQTSPQQ